MATPQRINTAENETLIDLLVTMHRFTQITAFILIQISAMFHILLKCAKREIECNMFRYCVPFVCCADMLVYSSLSY
jgi:hypothetical protein